MKEHLDTGILRRFITGELPSEESRRTDQHLNVCRDCRDLADEVSGQLSLELLESWLRPSYDEALDRVAGRTMAQLSQLLEEERAADDVLAELLREPAAQRFTRIREQRKFQSVKLCQLLRALSREKWSSDPTSALIFADLAVEVAQSLNRSKYGSGLVDDALALSYAYLGNAFRVKSDVVRAELAMRQAWLHLFEVGDVYTEVELLSFTASLRRTQGRSKEAVQLLDRAVKAHREGQDAEQAGLALIQKGHALGRGGLLTDAISVIRQGIRELEPSSNLRFQFIGRQNLAWALALSGAAGEAFNILKERPVEAAFGKLDLARIYWLEGEIVRDLGDLHRARTLISRAQELFLDCKVGIDVFLTSVDLAGVYFLNKQPRKVVEVLKDSIPLGEALGRQREVLLARALFERARAA